MSEQITVRQLKDSGKGKTDWARVRATSDEELEAAIATDKDSDVAGIDWTKGRLVMPQRKESIHLRIDPDVLAWYRNQGPGHLTRMNAVLKAYMAAASKG